MSDAVLTVGELTRAVKGQLEGTFPFVWVRGQVSNCSRPSSGHLYFSLKDDEALLNAVWFKGNQKDAEAFDPLTGEVFEDGPRPSLALSLENGQDVICAGKLTVYPPRGSYQLVVEIAQDAGIGRLQLEFERIKAELLAKGYFDAARKRPLPVNPARVAVVTALTGAAIRDFLRIGESRGMGGEVRIYPALVQGNEAPDQVAGAIRRMAEDGWAEVVAII
ncbi:MAG: exodeoxyribonuclease VII large subunit, partial [Deltaproteobacteria bacterium]|nr:exodeoxyribonuclease VII large subunit [Deltaproteobacteria bacterium]